jgi:hypothetical protein
MKIVKEGGINENEKEKKQTRTHTDKRNIEMNIQSPHDSIFLTEFFVY